MNNVNSVDYPDYSIVQTLLNSSQTINLPLMSRSVQSVAAFDDFAGITEFTSGRGNKTDLTRESVLLADRTLAQERGAKYGGRPDVTTQPPPASQQSSTYSDWPGYSVTKWFYVT
jgi:hypothetical protein